MSVITYKSRDNFVTVEPTSDKTFVLIVTNDTKAKFQIEPLWDMLKEALMNCDAGNSIDLQKRKREAFAAHYEGAGITKGAIMGGVEGYNIGG